MNENFSTQSGNFISALQTDVDVRTGQFTVNFPVATLTGNHLMGPDVSLILSYSPLNNNNYGFGRGFSVGITQFDNRTNLLELSNGEKYRVAPGSDTVRNQRLKNFRFSYTNGQDDADGYTVIWKEGKQERLTFVAENSFVTTRIISPLGRTLTLDWGWSGQYPLLTQINDETTPLCSIGYNNTTEIIVWPDTDEEYRVVLGFLNNTQLDTLTRQISEDESLDWYFSYDNVDGSQNLLLTGVTYPTGMTDEVQYSQINGLMYPEAYGITGRLPAVITHIRSPGAGQPDTLRQFAYTTENFMGYNGNFGDWDPDSDYIFTTLTDYQYGSTETLSDGDTNVITERTYNNYHLQIAETVTRGSSVHQTLTTYYAQEGYFIDAQPPQFQMPATQTTTWTDISLPEGEQSRSEIILTEFDDQGNPVRFKSPDGTTTVYEFYPAEGDGDNCPPALNGFVRFLKSAVTMPRSSDYDDAPQQTKTFTYDLLGDTDYIVQTSQTLFSGAVKLSVRTTAYNTDSKSSEFGRITALVDINYDQQQSYTCRQDFVTHVSNGLIDQTITFTGHDGLTATSRRTQSALSGLLFSETDAQSVTTVHTYDLLGRPLTRTMASGTLYENTYRWEYSIDKDGPATTGKDAIGNQVRYYFDGSGRGISEQRFDTDNTQQWFDIISRQYDALGQYQTGAGQDWVTTGTDTPENFVVKVSAGYDHWGNQSQLSFSDHTRLLTETNPVQLVTRQYSQGGATENHTVSGSTTTTLDTQSQLPVRKEMQDAAGAEQGIQKYVYDGLNRLREEEDERGNITRYDYDNFGREARRELADGTIVEREYAAHLSDSQVTLIRITGPDDTRETQTWTVGTREYDSLGRLTQEAVGGRITTYDYNDASQVPSKVTLPSGETLLYTYIPELSDAVASLTAGGLTQKFEYDPLTGDLLKATEGDTEEVNIWNCSGNLKQERFIRQDNPRQADYISTLTGEALAYTDVTGRQTRYKHNEYGMITRITDDSLTVTLDYDAMKRLTTQVVSDPVAGTSLTTRLAYDDFNKEITRTLTDDAGNTLTVEQTWLLNGLMSTRLTRQAGTILKDEQYDYDSRNRLTRYTVSGSMPPPDAYGYLLAAQTYQYDALNNLTEVVTTLADGTTDIATFHYQNKRDPMQLSRVTHTHPAYPQVIDLQYDAGGRMIKDEAARTLTYDATGRLIGISDNDKGSGTYGYDALNKLISQQVSIGDTRQLYYRGSELVNEVLTEQGREIRLLKNGHSSLGINDSHGTTLTAVDHKDSPVWSRRGTEEVQLHGWSPYGSGDAVNLMTGFNGERIDPLSGCYSLGNGYRAYNPVLMRFNCPDSLSPFDTGGINPYAYCAGDPINFTDPTGHMSWMGGLGIGLGILGILGAVVTAGLSVTATSIALALTTTLEIGAAVSTANAVTAAIGSASALTLTLGTAGVVADVTGIASGAIEDTRPRESAILGWVSLGLGATGLTAGLAAGLKGGIKRVKNQRIEGITLALDTELLNGKEFPRGYTNNFRGTGEDALLLHGTDKGNLVVGTKVSVKPSGAKFTDTRYTRIVTPARVVSGMRDELNIDLYASSGSTGPVHLLSCLAKQQAAQALADELGRPVIGYSKHSTFAASLDHIQDPKYVMKASLSSNDLRRCFGMKMHRAAPRTFYPKVV